MQLIESYPELMFEMALEFCIKYAPDEVLLLELNKKDLMEISRAKADKPRMYAEALGVGISEEVVLPVVLFVINVIARDIVTSVYRSAKAQFVSYLCNCDSKKLEALVGDNQYAKETVRKLREMLCGGDINQH